MIMSQEKAKIQLLCKKKMKKLISSKAKRSTSKQIRTKYIPRNQKEVDSIYYKCNLKWIYPYSN